MRLSGRRFFFHLGSVIAATALVACGGGGGGGGNSNTSASTFNLGGSVTGLTGGTLVLQVAGRSDVNVTANGTVSLATGLNNGGAYSVSVRTQPAGHECTVTNGTGSIAGANISNVQIVCSAEVRLSLTAPADNVLVPVNAAQDITATFGNITSGELDWEVLPAGMASNVTLAQSATAAGTVTMAFTATAPGNYTVRVTASTDDTKTAQVDLRVHQVFLAIDSLEQRRTFLRADGSVLGTALANGPDQSGAPTDALQAISQGWLFRLGIRNDGSVVIWGAGAGNGTTITLGTPPSGLVATHVAAGYYHSIAIREDGTLAVWGRVNGIDAVVPDALTSTQFIAADAANGFFAAIRADGTLAVWQDSQNSLITLPTDWQGRSFAKLCAANSYVVALDATGIVRTWNTSSSSAAQLLGTAQDATAVYCGSDVAVVVQENGRVQSWGVGPGAPGTPLFDSSTVSGFRRIKGASIFAIGATYFLTEGGAVIDVDGNVVTGPDSL